MEEVLILGAVRTPIGRFGGAFREVPANTLGGLVIGCAVAEAEVEPDRIDEVIMGSALQTDPRGNPAREAALAAGLPVSVPAFSVNKNCGSAVKALILAAQSIRGGDAGVVVAGGQENMSRQPHLLRGARWGYRLGDSTVSDLLTDAITGMGQTAENVARRYQISRQRQDEFAVQSHRRALATLAAGHFAAQIVPVPVSARGAFPAPVTTDEAPRPDTTFDRLASLRPAFAADGSVTAGNSCPMNDGAAALVLAAGTRAERLGRPVLGRLVAWGTAGLDPDYMGMGPVPATRTALERAGLAVADLDLVELNEAFAAQALAVMDELELDPVRTNVNGGAIALGHPVGATGAILVVKILAELRRRGGRFGLVTMCIGGGQGIALVVEAEGSA